VRRSVVTAALAAALAAIGCGGGQNPRNQSRAYAAADAAFHHGDFEAALEGFRALDGYRDAARRLSDVRKAGGRAELAAAETKLRTGHPRAALVLVQVAMRDYRDTGPAAQAMLHRAQAAQAIHHNQGLARQAQLAHRQARGGNPHRQARGGNP
jgi:hypothetical protein